MIKLESSLSALNIIHILYTIYSMHSLKLVLCHTANCFLITFIMANVFLVFVFLIF